MHASAVQQGCWICPEEGCDCTGADLNIHTHTPFLPKEARMYCLIYARGCEELTFLQGNLSLSVCTARTEKQDARKIK